MKPFDHREHPSTYCVGDRSSKEDQARLQILDQMMTQAMGGVLPEQPADACFRHVLDVGCGTGGWLIELARSSPRTEQLYGVDISRRMVRAAHAQAEAAGLDTGQRVRFLSMDALRRLEFPAGYFDLINQRCGASYLRTWDWPHLLREYQRVGQPGGIVRITEGEWAMESPSQALTHLFELLLQAFHRAGHSFTLARDGVTSELAALLHRQGFREVQCRVIHTDYQAGTPALHLLRDDLRLTFKMLIPFLHKWTMVPDDYDFWYQQALEDMQQPDFRASGQMLTVWASVFRPAGMFFC